MDDALKGVFGIASALIGVAVLTLLIGQANNTKTVIATAGDTLNTLLKTVTLQNGMGNMTNFYGGM